MRAGARDWFTAGPLFGCVDSYGFRSNAKLWLNVQSVHRKVRHAVGRHNFHFVKCCSASLCEVVFEDCADFLALSQILVPIRAVLMGDTRH